MSYFIILLTDTNLYAISSSGKQFWSSKSLSYALLLKLIILIKS